ncbi:MAG: GNAT family N-acetyltransferase [Pseudomonadota bacterium]
MRETDAGSDLRRARPSDAVALGHLHVTCWQEAYADLLPPAVLERQTVDDRIDLWRQVLRQPDKAGSTRVFVAEADGALVGFGACGRQRANALAEKGYDAEIDALYVRRAHQRKGLGSALFVALLDDLRASGFRSVSLWVLIQNQGARSFYEGLGGQQTGDQQEDQAHSITEIAYGWPLLAI